MQMFQTWFCSAYTNRFRSGEIMNIQKGLLGGALLAGGLMAALPGDAAYTTTTVSATKTAEGYWESTVE